jgi:hypothetical protein
MRRRRIVMVGITVLVLVLGLGLGLAACDRSPPASGDAGNPANATTPSPAAASAPSVDAELEQLKTVTPVDACTWLTPEKLKAVYPGLGFEVHQKLEPRMSGYVWDSRCVYWAGVGTVDFAKDTPTHTLEIFVATAASDVQAQAKLASRRETATSATGYQAQPGVGTNAYTTLNTGVVTLFFVKGQSEVQLNLSDLDTPSDEKIKRLIALAQSL